MVPAETVERALREHGELTCEVLHLGDLLILLMGFVARVLCLLFRSEWFGKHGNVSREARWYNLTSVVFLRFGLGTCW